MAIKWIGASHKTDLETSFPAKDRVYVDFRQKVYPALIGQDFDHTLITSGANQPGSHNLTSGHGDYLLALTSAITVMMRVLPTFAFNVGSDQVLWSWYVDANNYLKVYYTQADDKYTVEWKDGGTLRQLKSAAYVSDVALQVWTDICVTIDLSTGDTTGGTLYIDRVAVDEAWSGAIDAKGMEYPLFSVRHEAETEGGYTIAFARMFLSKVATAAEVANDFETLKEEEIFWYFNDETIGKTRCNVTRHVTGLSTNRQKEDRVTGSAGANRATVKLHNESGIFSDDQYAAFDPTLDQFNGVVAKSYMKHRTPAIVESWYSNDFEPIFVGKVDSGRFSRVTRKYKSSWVTLSCEDGIAEIANTKKDKAVTYDGKDLSDSTETNSLLHLIARQATQKSIINFAANSNFEAATIGNSWTVAGTGATFDRVAGGLGGSFQGDLVYGSALCSYNQIITFTGVKKLNLGETYNFSVYLKCAAAAARAAGIILAENDAGGENDSSTANWTLSGGEGWKKFEVSHTITDDASDRLIIKVESDDDLTVSSDYVMLIQNDIAVDWFVVNDNEGSSGTESADDADSASYDSIGFNVEAHDVVHPWAIVKANQSMWTKLKEIGIASAASYLGLDAAGTFVMKTPFVSGYSDPSPISTIAATTSIASAIAGVQANRIVIHGIQVVKSSHLMEVWNALESGVFNAVVFPAGPASYIELMSDGEAWPAPGTYTGGFWAKYKLGDWRDWDPYELNIPGFRHDERFGGAGPAWKIVGLGSPVLVYAAIGDVAGANAYVQDLTQTTFNATTRPTEAEILLTNSTGANRQLINVAIRGKPIYQAGADEGWINDGFVDEESIRKNGDIKLEIANSMIVTNGVVNNLADFWWKWNRTKKHVYRLSLPGTQYFYEPGEWYTLDLGGAGEEEYVDATVECYSIETERDGGGLGKTILTLREVEENWKFDSNFVARYLASSSFERNRGIGEITIASSTYVGQADIYCDGTADQTEINEVLAQNYRVVRLTEGTFILSAAIELKSNVLLVGRGPSTIIEKNANDYAIEAVGSGGSELTNIGLSDFKVTRNASDTNTVSLVYLQYADNVIMQKVILDSSDKYALEIDYCDYGIFDKCELWENSGNYYIYITNSTHLVIEGCLLDGREVEQSNVLIYGIIVSTGSYINIINNIIRNIKTSNVVVAGIAVLANYSQILNNKIYNLESTVNGDISTDGAYGMLLRSCSYTKAEDNRIWDVISGRDITVPAVGIDIGHASGGLANEVRNNTISEIRGRAIWVTNADDTIISGNHCKDNGGLIDRNRCESNTSPMIFGETVPVKAHAGSGDDPLWARDNAQAHEGTYSFKFTKKNTSG